MAYWLFKTEPSTYGFPQLTKDKETTWDGVANPQALAHLRQVKRGDEIFFYHTGDEKAVVGVMAATADASGDPPTVKVKPLRALARPVTLAELKADPATAGWELTRLPRLSIMPVPEKIWRLVLALAEKPAAASSSGRKK
jgi:predicted RNA-binding protein with PUA-like domain